MAHEREVIGFIGAGNMAQAIGYGFLSSGLIPSSLMIVSAPTDGNLQRWKSMGAKTTHSNAKVVKESSLTFLAMKPDCLDKSLEPLSEQIFKEEKLFVSLLAGVNIESLEKKLRKYVPKARVIRAMPNTPLMVGSGCIVYSCGSEVTQQDVTLLEKLFLNQGVCRQVKEKLINVAGAIMGSGPAFMYMVMDALADGGVLNGMPRELALELASQTMLGASKMVQKQGRHPMQLKEEVCSPGGSTISGVHVLEKGALRGLFIDAISASVAKSEELGKVNE